MAKSKRNAVDEYIDAAPEYAREKLNEIRSLLKSVAPNASEELKWGQPVFIEKQFLFAYAAFKNHLTFMPTGPAFEPFRNELSSYKTGKDTVQFKYDKPLPKRLITRTTRYRRSDVIKNGAKWMY